MRTTLGWVQLKPSQAARRVGRWAQIKPSYRVQLKLPQPTGLLGTEFRADELIASLSGRSWRTRSAGPGSKGDRRYAWARTRVNGANDPQAEHWLLARRSLTDPTDMAYYIGRHRRPRPGWPRRRPGRTPCSRPTMRCWTASPLQPPGTDPGKAGPDRRVFLSLFEPLCGWSLYFAESFRRSSSRPRCCRESTGRSPSSVRPGICS
jgi:hypothetical protein